MPTPALVRAAVVAALVGGFGVSAWLTSGEGRPLAAATAVPPQPIGSAGCASSNCHGQPVAELTLKLGPDAWKQSLTIWSAVDPHTNATAVLDPKRNATAARMQAAFRKSQPDFNPQTDSRCLACHTNPALANPDLEPSKVVFRGDGVGCEACHGNAATWQVPHYQWATVTDRATGITTTGMTDLNSHTVRAKHCAGCHVGAPADPTRGYTVRDMNHDMIAAGHPRLIFDYSTHLLRLPKHWQEKDRTKPGTPPKPPGDELAAWVAGQLAAAEAQCELTADRATRKSPWPELADFNCYSCHHNLVPASWRVKAGPAPGKPPGRPGFDLPWPTADLAGAGAKDLVVTLNRATEPEDVTAAAGKLTELLRNASAKGDADAAIRSAVEALSQSDRVLMWDDAYRAYLALNALDLSRSDYPARAEVRKGLDELAGALALPGHPTEQRYTPDDVKKRLARIATQIK